MGDAILRIAADTAAHAPLLLVLLVLVVSTAGSALPFSPVEPLIVLVGATSGPGVVAAVIVAATASHMVSKTLLFVGSGRARRSLPARHCSSVDRARALLSRRPALRAAVLLASAATSLPPFYPVTIAAGVLRLPLREFVILGTIGRAIHFTACALLPRLFVPALAIVATSSSR